MIANAGCTVGRSILGGPEDDGGGQPDITMTDATGDTVAPTDTRPGCLSDNECRADQFCDMRTGQCAPGCSRDEGCSGETPRCNTMSHTCVPCVTDMHCPSGQVCRGNRCVMGCSPTQPCPGGQTCCTDACIDTQTNSANCGACGTMCNIPNAEPSCSMGRCAVGRCSGNFGDCDNNAMNGCETDTGSSAAHCGRCGNPCPVPPNATATCAAGMCGFRCNDGFADCNMNAADGCEVDLRTSVGNCGRCGTMCAVANGVPACVAGMCRVGRCSPGFENCDNIDANGCEANTTNDPSNCGGCSRVCGMLANSTPSCSMGVCGIGMCLAGFADCNRVATDGCEVNTRTNAMNCGACGRTCNLANATSDCTDGACRLVRCNPGFADCDGNPLNGCETNTNTDIDHCGGCGRVCPVPPGGGAACNMGTCGISTCVRPRADCNMNPGDGCEVDTDTDVRHCGACNAPCATPANASPGCARGMCGIGACNPGFADCNMNPADGCEVNIALDPRNCGSCGRVCASLPNATPTCALGMCGLGACLPGFDNCDGMVANGCESNLGTSNVHCGRCGNACTGGQSCVLGTCQCPAGQSLCGGVCTALATDARNCGACGRVCAAGQTCVAGSCQCPAGQTLCGTTCVDTQLDVRNCGGCGRVCAVDQTCVMGACIGTGQLRFTATWSTAGDVDLHVVPPCGTEISYITRTACGGTLDRDDTTGTGPENIFWSTGAATGNYLVCAVPYSISGSTTVTVNVVRGATTVRTFTRTYTASTGNQACTTSSPSYLGTYTF
ncbi:MAG: hypothetical protein JNK05_29730 [Myxococcales bacterium]|nr:hypothetical protein [Myxococcales bacterium]